MFLKVLFTSTVLFISLFCTINLLLKQLIVLPLQSKMNFEGAKENIQPLAAGRNVEQLEVALNAESNPEYQEELLQKRKQFEQEISQYVGDDPLDLWFDYVTWVEQSYPKSGKESALDDLLKTCLSKFERDDRYKQDVRYIRLFIKYVSLDAVLSVRFINRAVTMKQFVTDRYQGKA